MHITFDLTRGGRVYSNISPRKLANIGVIAKRVITRAAKDLTNRAIKNANQDIRTSFGTKLRRRKLVDSGWGVAAKQMHLEDAYSEAMSRSQIVESPTGVGIKIFDIAFMDNVTPLSNRAQSVGGGWWRYHEIGSPSKRIGQHSDYAFVKKETLDAIFGEDEDHSGRHGEGMLISMNTELAKRMKLKPNTNDSAGAPPLRILGSLQNSMGYFIQSRMNIKSVMDEVASSLR